VRLVRRGDTMCVFLCIGGIIWGRACGVGWNELLY
jgi:hypothetical protein